jgi:hypothetical protein
MNYEHRLRVGRVIMGLFAVLAVLVLVQGISEGSTSKVIPAALMLLVCAWWFHLWGVQGDPPPGARNRLPWQ